MLLKELIQEKRDMLKRSSYEEHIKEFAQELIECAPELVGEGIVRLSVSMFMEWLKRKQVIKNRLSQDKFYSIVKQFTDLGFRIVDSGQNKTRYYFDLEHVVNHREYLLNKLQGAEK